MAFGVIIIGDEILSGRRIDKHLPKVIELLSDDRPAAKLTERLLHALLIDFELLLTTVKLGPLTNEVWSSGSCRANHARKLCIKPG